MNQVNGSPFRVSGLFRVGVFLCVLTLLYGVLLGGAFGASEARIKGSLQARYEAAVAAGTLNELPNGGISLRNKAWDYVKRSHLHANGMGAGGLGLAFALMLAGVVNRWGGLAVLAAGIGGVGYSLFWLAAGFRLPAIGNPDQAKESLYWFAVPSSGLYIFAILFGAIAVLMFCIRGSRPASSGR